MPEIPASLLDLMAEIGPRWGTNIAEHAALMQKAFTELHANAHRPPINVARDIAYGPHPRQRLDVFSSRHANGAPVVLFVHGGAFVRGDRNATPELYANVLYYFARHGMVGINMEYRLARDAPWPGGAEDVGAAIAWIKTNVAHHGGDPEKIFVIGHSAGGSHVATWAYDRRVHGDAGPSIAGAIIVGGRVRADSRPDDPNCKNVEAYFGPDKKLQAERSPVMHAAGSSLPTFIAIAQYENPFLDVYCLELAWRIAASRGRAPRVVQAMGHNHISMVCHFNTADDWLGRQIREFMGSALLKKE